MHYHHCRDRTPFALFEAGDISYEDALRNADSVNGDQARHQAAQQTGSPGQQVRADGIHDPRTGAGIHASGIRDACSGGVTPAWPRHPSRAR